MNFSLAVEILKAFQRRLQYGTNLWLLQLHVSVREQQTQTVFPRSLIKSETEPAPQNSITIFCYQQAIEIVHTHKSARLKKLP